MPKQTYAAGEAARLLGISVDTLRRWDKQGRIQTLRDAANRRVVPASEIDRLAGGSPDRTLSARNRFPGVIAALAVEGLLAQVEVEVTEPVRVIAVITKEAAEQLGLKPGMRAAALVKATSVMIER